MARLGRAVLELCSNLPDRSREEQGEGLPKNRHQRHSAVHGTQLGLLSPLAAQNPGGQERKPVVLPQRRQAHVDQVKKFIPSLQ